MRNAGEVNTRITKRRVSYYLKRLTLNVTWLESRDLTVELAIVRKFSKY